MSWDDDCIGAESECAYECEDDENEEECMEECICQPIKLGLKASRNLEAEDLHNTTSQPLVVPTLVDHVPSPAEPSVSVVVSAQGVIP